MTNNLPNNNDESERSENANQSIKLGKKNHSRQRI